MRPYSDTFEHLTDELERLDLLLRLYLEEWWAERGTTVDEFRGLYVSDEEVDGLLRSGHGGELATGRRAGGDDALLERIEDTAERIRERTSRTLENRTELRLVELSDRFDLDRRHVNALLIGLAPELDRKYEKVYAYLQDDVTEKRPTVDLALRILGGSEKGRLEARTLFARSSPLVRHRLVRFPPEDGATLLSRSIAVEARVVDFLLGSDELDDDLAGFTELKRPEKDEENANEKGKGQDYPRVDAETTEALERLSRTRGNRRGSNRLLAYFHGPYGSGKEAAAEALCIEGETPVLKIDGGALAEGNVLEILDLLVREAHLQGAALHVADVTSSVGDTVADLETVVRRLDGFDGAVFLSETEPLSPRLHARVTNHELAVVGFPIPSYELRRELWDGVDSLPEDLNTADLATKFRLTGGQIEDAVSTARVYTNGEGLTTEAVYRGCRAQSSEKLDSLARKVEPTYTWDDIVLPTDKVAHLREVAADIRHRGRVYSEWGFREKFSLGNGLNVLFTGPSGTGKTMAAEIIAKDAGLDLYKIDLSGVVSKYIGETEKNLREIFDEAENSSAILFFDEADALFGKRSEVKDSHDRYANIEVNYLLQRIEEHDGIVILTTNIKKNIDDAFVRRIHRSVDFPLPGEEAREAIWRTVFPEETPLSELDVEFLRTFRIAGGNIKNIALNAAFLAADDPARDAVEMEHVVRAARREFQKTGKLTTPEDFGAYRDVLPQ